MLEENKKYQYNIYFAYVSHFLMAFSYGWVIIKIIFYENLGLSFQEISILIATIPLFSFLSEIPTGIFTDFYGRKTSIIISFILSVISSYFLIYPSGFLDLFLSASIFGIAWGFWSGSFESLIYESAKKLGKKKEYTSILSKTEFIYTSLGIATNILISYVFEIDNKIPFIIMFVLETILIFLSFYIVETEQRTKIRIIKHLFREQLFSIFKFLKNNKHIKFLVLYNAIWGSTLGLFATLLNQPLIYKSYELIEYGYIFAITTIVQSSIIYFSDKIINKIEDKNPFLIFVLVWFFSIIAMVLFLDNLFILIPTMAISWSIGTILSIFLSNQYNHSIKDDQLRASLLSSISMINSFVYIIAILLFGLIIDLIDIKSSVIIMSIIYLSIGLYMSIYVKKKLY